MLYYVVYYIRGSIPSPSTILLLFKPGHRSVDQLAAQAHDWVERRLSQLGVGALPDAARCVVRAAVAAVDLRGPLAKLVATPPYMIVHMLALLQVSRKPGR